MGFKVELDVADPVEFNCEACPSLGFWEGFLNVPLDFSTH